MKKLIITLLLLAATGLHSAEITPKWNRINEAGEIHDLEFLKGEDTFILIAGIGEKGVIEIRQTETGELVRSLPIPYLSYKNQIEVTSDSSKILITTGGDKESQPTIELRNINDFTLINSFKLEMDADSLDEKGGKLYYRFRQANVDPIRPLIYTIVEKTNYISNYTPEKYWLRVYNYETMEEVTDLTPVGYENENLKCFDISDDGKLLAALNDGKTFLKVWDLENLKLIENIKIYDNDYDLDPNYYACVLDDIEFSSVDNNLIYLSGKIPDKSVEYSSYGFYKFLISEKLKIKEMIDMNKVGGRFTFFSDESRVLLSGGVMNSVFNLIKNERELYAPTDIKYPTGSIVLYSNLQNCFLGAASHIFGTYRIDTESNIIEIKNNNHFISPNPTNSHVNLNLNCISESASYSIVNQIGKQLEQKTILSNSNELRLDFSAYPSGVYFLTINCGNDVKTYKVVREG